MRGLWTKVSGFSCPEVRRPLRLQVPSLRRAESVFLSRDLQTLPRHHRHE